MKLSMFCHNAMALRAKNWTFTIHNIQYYLDDILFGGET